MSEKPFDHYLPFELMDFVLDEDFQDWTRHPNPEREAYWQAFLLAFPQKTGAVTSARRVLRSLRVADWQHLTPEQLQQRYQALSLRLEDRAPGTPADPVRVVRWGAWPAWVRAAAVVVPALLGWGLYQYGWAETEYQTTYGEQQRILLNDQTLVTLAANSQLRVPGRWRFSRQREVWLRGEGYFEVARQSNAERNRLRNFFVHTRELKVEVLGTRFNVNTHRGKTTVLLDEGQIRLSALQTPQRWLLLRPGQLAEVPGSRPQVSVRPSTDPTLTAWREGRLIFRNTPLADLRQRMQEVYGLTLVLEGEGWDDVEYTGELPVRDAALSTQILAETFGATPTLENDRLVLLKPTP